MNVDAYLGHVPAIEKLIADHKLDALVCGMGPTAWLLPWMDRSLIAPLRLWGCHDACRVLPMDDLVIMDSAVNALHPDTTRYAEVIKARPKRLWVYDRNWPSWNGRIHPSVVKVMKTVPWAVCDPRSAERTVAAQRTKTFDCIPFKLEADPIQTTAISPTGMTTLAWREGCRRIGIIGVDMQKSHHHSYRSWPLVDSFFRKMAEQAHERGGCIMNLSPVTSLKGFAAWTPSASSSPPTVGSKPPEPSASSNTASASTPPAPSTSAG